MVSRIVYEHAGEPDKEGKLRVLSKIEVLQPNEVCTDSYLVVGPFGTKREADNAARYISSKLVRFLIAQTLSSINLSKDKFSFVPMRDFSKDVIERNLYEEYGLTDKEIELIENSIHPIEQGK